VAIARALITEPALLLADEPTGNLDSTSSAEIMALFEQLNQQGITIVVVTHEPDVAAHAGRVLTVRDGLLDSDTAPQRQPFAGGATPTVDHGRRHGRPSIVRRAPPPTKRRSI
jgi:putative ABC transport system ATP-binding protein